MKPANSITAANRNLIVLITLAAALPVSAVCLDPKTFVSGYHRPLNKEVHSTKLIALGKIIKEKALQEDPSDPDGVTAYIYTIQIVRQLKGRLPKIVSVRIENESGRYPMSVGEDHLLFLAKNQSYFSVDSCGNSTIFPQGNTVLKEIEAM